jgi:hypothetical protein
MSGENVPKGEGAYGGCPASRGIPYTLGSLFSFSAVGVHPKQITWQCELCPDDPVEQAPTADDRASAGVMLQFISSLASSVVSMIPPSPFQSGDRS